MPLLITNEVLAERIENLCKNNDEGHAQIKEILIEKISEHRGLIEKHEDRIKTLENWKLVFVAKFSVYAAVALFAGSMVAQLFIRWFDKIVIK